MLQFIQEVLADSEGIHNDPVLIKLDEVETSEAGRVLILEPALDPELLALHNVGKVCHFVLSQRQILEFAKEAHQTYHQRRRRAQPRSGWSIAV